MVHTRLQAYTDRSNHRTKRVRRRDFGDDVFAGSQSNNGRNTICAGRDLLLHRIAVRRVDVINRVFQHCACHAVQRHDLQTAPRVRLCLHGCCAGRLRRAAFRLAVCCRFVQFSRDTLLFRFSELDIIALHFVGSARIAVLVLPYTRGELTDHDSKRAFLEPLLYKLRRTAKSDARNEVGDFGIVAACHRQSEAGHCVVVLAAPQFRISRQSAHQDKVVNGNAAHFVLLYEYFDRFLR